MHACMQVYKRMACENLFKYGSLCKSCTYESSVVFLVIRIFISNTCNLVRTVHNCISKQMLILTHYSPNLCQVFLCYFLLPH